MEQTQKQTLDEFQNEWGFNPAPFSLEAVTSSKKFEAQKILIYGTPGIGKTTFAATFPSPILLRTEDGAKALDIPTFPQVADTYKQFREACKALCIGKHSFKTLIVDSLDWLEPLVWKKVCEENRLESIEKAGYGKGYVMADEVWKNARIAFDTLNDKGMNIVLIAHSQATTVDLPDSEPYQRYGIKLHKRAAGMWMEWAEMALFLAYQMKVKKIDASSKTAKATGDGDRIIYTQERPAWQAKSRWPLPEKIYIGKDETWSDFHRELNKATDGAYKYDLPDNDTDNAVNE